MVTYASWSSGEAPQPGPRAKPGPRARPGPMASLPMPCKSTLGTIVMLHWTRWAKTRRRAVRLPAEVPQESSQLQKAKPWELGMWPEARQRLHRRPPEATPSHPTATPSTLLMPTPSLLPRATQNLPLRVTQSPLPPKATPCPLLRVTPNPQSRVMVKLPPRVRQRQVVPGTVPMGGQPPRQLPVHASQTPTVRPALWLRCMSSMAPLSRCASWRGTKNVSSGSGSGRKPTQQSSRAKVVRARAKIARAKAKERGSQKVAKERARRASGD
mmetsp:Transcript_54999/g.152486  ORF Transcript_54999/g.152486 Transcript_54999/m.152486 type:complete len:270 (-) Transcript_54999:94-903(-)